MQSILTSTTILIASLMSSQGALTLTFTEEGGDVVMRASGSVDVTNGTLGRDQTWTVQSSSGSSYIYRNGISADQAPIGSIFEVIEGVDILGVDFISSGSFTGSMGLGSGDFRVRWNTFTAFSLNDTGIIDDDIQNSSVSSSTREVTYSGQTFATMGLDAHATNTTIGLWAARDLGGGTYADSETVNFVVSTGAVPEPSSMILSGLGGLALLARRRRK